MNRNDLQSDDSFESDAVWKLLDEAAPARPRASFADDVVRMAKLEPVSEPWWKSWRVMLPSAGLAAAAAVALVITLAGPKADHPALEHMGVAENTAVAPKDDFAELQDFAETETLIAAADHLDDFSDQELVSLIGF